MTARSLLGGALILAAAWGCTVDVGDSNAAGGAPDVTGTYVSADSGTTLGKHWCYSGALVLDSTRHFGSVLTMCSDEGAPVTEHLKGSYRLRRVATRVDGGSRVLRRLTVVLDQEGSRSKTHTLRYDAGNLRFDEPWWLGAGLRALEVPDPVLRKISGAQLEDSTVVTAVSSTASQSGKSSAPIPAAKKSARKSPPTK